MKASLLHVYAKSAFFFVPSKVSLRMKGPSWRWTQSMLFSTRGERSEELRGGCRLQLPSSFRRAVVN